MTAAPDVEPHALRVRAVVPGRGLDVDLDVEAGQVVALLGENGAGKSTLLHAVCGLVRPDVGRVSVGDHVVLDTARGVWVPPHRRRAALLAQDPTLFPHLSVQENVAFGPRSRGVPRREARALALRWLAAVEVADAADRAPSTLSGGQAQRVALARALATDPAVLLLDEPLSAVDVALAPTLRRLLAGLLRGTGRTTVLVTHDLLDALALADRVVVLEGGRVVEDGPAREVLDRPRSTFAARLAGVNILHGVATPDGLATATGLVVRGLVDRACTLGGPAVALVAPNAVAVHLTPTDGSPRNHIPAVVTALEPRGAVVRVHTREAADGGAHLAADVTAAAATDLGLVPGLRVELVVKATEIGVHPAGAGGRGAGVGSAG